MISLFAAYQVVLLPIFFEACAQEWQKNSLPSTASAAKSSSAETTKMSSPEDQVREAAQQCLEYWCLPSVSGSGGSSDNKEAVHKECSVMSLLDGGTPMCEAGHQFTFSSESSFSSSNGILQNDDEQVEQTFQPQIISVKILPVGSQNAAAVRVSMRVSSTTSIQGWLTLLKKSGTPQNKNDKNPWVCIAAAFSSTTSPSANCIDSINNHKILPQHFQAVTRLVWDGYCHANRNCNGPAMGQVFHKTCRLTFAMDNSKNSVTDDDDDKDGIVICPQPAFLSKVQRRYASAQPHEATNPHLPYAPLQQHPDIGQYDGMESIEFVSANLCMVTVRVAHPPCVWTDLLTCCRLPGNDMNHDNNSNNFGGWWIVHKSSCQEEYQLTDDMKHVLEEYGIRHGYRKTNSGDPPLGRP